MLGFLEFLTSFYWPLLPETILQTLRRANWNRAYARHGAPGLLLEAAESVLGTNTCVFFTPIDGAWDGRSIAISYWKSTAFTYGGWGYECHEFFFHVRREDMPPGRNRSCTMPAWNCWAKGAWRADAHTINQWC